MKKSENVNYVMIFSAKPKNHKVDKVMSSSHPSKFGPEGLISPSPTQGNCSVSDVSCSLGREVHWLVPESALGLPS